MADAASPTSPPAGWKVISFKSGSRPDEYCYYNRLTYKTVRVSEMPTAPPPDGIDLLRDDSVNSGWAGVSEVGKVTKKFQARWRCSALHKVRALPGLHNTPEEAAAALYNFIDSGAVFDKSETAEHCKRGTKPQEKRKERAPSGSVPMPADKRAVKNPTMATWLKEAPTASSAYVDIDAEAMTSFQLAMDGSGELA